MTDKKPLCPIIGEDGNIFNLLGIVSKTLRKEGMKEEAEKMYEEVTSASDYDEALRVIMNYVEPCDAEEYEEQSTMILE